MAELNHERREEEGEKRIELSLGLSLNGKFGIDPKAKKLERCYSISNIGVEKTGISWERVALPLSRTCSLPVEAEEESRKRKEIQMLRRREAKQRRALKMAFPSQHPLSSQGSSASSSAFSDFDTLTPPSGMNRSAESKSPQSVQSLEQNEHRSLPTEKSSEVDNGAGATEVNPPTKSFSGAGEMVRNVLADMPSVSTRGDGPNGKRIEGFLYRYKKGEEVRIVCVCHGSFLTPAEFVKHAGGGDVEHPLRHIVVTSSPFL